MLRSWVFRFTAPTASGSAKSRRSAAREASRPCGRRWRNFSGIGPRTVIMFADALQQKNDRIELSMTAAEVKDTIAKQRLEQEQGQEDKKSEQK